MIFDKIHSTFRNSADKQLASEILLYLDLRKEANGEVTLLWRDEIVASTGIIVSSVIEPLKEEPQKRSLTPVEAVELSLQELQPEICKNKSGADYVRCEVLDNVKYDYHKRYRHAEISYRDGAWIVVGSYATKTGDHGVILHRKF